MKKTVEICKDWCKITGYSEKTFYNWKKELQSLDYTNFSPKKIEAIKLLKNPKYKKKPLTQSPSNALIRNKRQIKHITHKVKGIGNKGLKATLNAQFGVYTDGHSWNRNNQRTWEGIKWKK